MTDTQPDALRLADELETEFAQGRISNHTGRKAATELRRQHSENETLRVERERNLNSIRVCNEIINKKNAELESLRTGYAAARLEIESLQARIKTMAEEHADELMVAHLDGRMRAAQPAGAQQPTTQTAPQQEAQEPYSIDADPQGIRALVADAITGALAFGAQGTNAPPDGHWLAPFWAAARAESEAAPQPSPASHGNGLDTARLDWLDKNIFHRDMDEWDAKHGGRGDCNMWVMFAPKGAQGSARSIIDAARKQGANHD